jgi:hypothetical protein
VTSLPLAVYEASVLELALPAARDDGSAHAVVRGWSDCGYGIGEERRFLQGQRPVIELDYEFLGCHIVPFGPQVFELEHDLDVGPGTYEVRLFDHREPGPRPRLARGTLRVWDAAGCFPGPETLCLHDGRFRVKATWTDFAGATGEGRALPLEDSDDSGLLWFFDPENVEATVRVLEACGVNGRFWVFLAGGSTAAYTVQVEDTRSGVARTYEKPLHEVPRLVADTDAFDCP